MDFIDLRSDTVTRPTAEMLAAMAAAEVGDDVFGEDPTVKKLEETAARILGKQAGLLVTSGTMGNLVSVLTHTQKGDEVLLESESHINYYEVGGISALAGAMPRPVQGQKGKITAQGLAEALRPENIHFPTPALLCLENTHNRGGGTVSTPSEMQEVIAPARQHGLKVHLDGARIFNAALAAGVKVSELAVGCDSVMFCLSKGLGAPVGSLVTGSGEFIASARKWRKMVGGGMRQAGVIAAAGLVALETMTERLAEDHANARFLAAGLANIPKLRLDASLVQTNIVVVDLAEDLGGADAFLTRLKAEGVLATGFGPHTVRFVTHKDVNRQGIDFALQVITRMVR